MDSTDATVLLIDDDLEVRDGVGRLLRSAGWRMEAFASAQEFMEQPPYEGIGCLVLDVSMPGMSGPDLHRWMHENDRSLPVIYLSARCDVSISVAAMKRGAVDVLEKPADADVLLQAIAEAVELHRLETAQRRATDDIRRRHLSLSRREGEVMTHVVSGRLNKQIADDLGISLKTVKVHRGRMMVKMGVRSVAELVHLCGQLPQQ